MNFDPLEALRNLSPEQIEKLNNTSGRGPLGNKSEEERIRILSYQAQHGGTVGTAIQALAAIDSAPTSAEGTSPLYTPLAPEITDKTGVSGGGAVPAQAGRFGDYTPKEWGDAMRLFGAFDRNSVPKVQAMAIADQAGNAPSGYVRPQETFTGATGTKEGKTTGTTEAIGGGKSLGQAMPADRAAWIQARPDLQGSQAIDVPQLALSKGVHAPAKISAGPKPAGLSNRHASAAIQNAVTIQNAVGRAEDAAIADELRG